MQPVSTDPWCELESDLSLPYPDCCPRPKCPEIVEEESEENDVSRIRSDEANISVTYDVTLEDTESGSFEVVPGEAV